MIFEFTPFQVLSGEVEYSLSEFKEFLKKEILDTLSNFNLKQDSLDFYCDIMYIMFYWFAVNGKHKDLRQFYNENLSDDIAFKEPLTTMSFLLQMEQDNLEIIAMFKAILTRMSLHNLDTKMSFKEARANIEQSVGIYINQG